MSIVEPSKIPVPFADSGLKNAIPQAANNTTGKAGFDKGFPERTMLPKASDGIPPSGMDFNGILYDITSAIRYMQAGGRPTYDAAFASAIGGYPSGAVLIGDDGVSVFQNTVAGNETDPNSGGAGWTRPDLQVMELYRRSYAEAGYNLVDGSFEAGGTLVNANDVLLQESTGKAFSGPVGVVAAGTNPERGGFVDKSGSVQDLVHTRTFANVEAMQAFNGHVVGNTVETLSKNGEDLVERWLISNEPFDWTVASISLQSGLKAIKLGATLKEPRNKNLEIVAHRASPFVWMEGTMMGYSSTDADWLEIDVQITSDGVPVLYHDDTLDTKTNGSGEIKNNTLAQVQSAVFLDAIGTPYEDLLRIPTLEEFCKFAAENGRKFWWETKKYRDQTDITIMVDVIESYGLQSRSILNSFIFGDLIYAQTLSNEIQMAYTLGSLDPSFEPRIHTMSSEWNNKPWVLVYHVWLRNNPEFIETMRGLGIEVAAWTPNRIEEIRILRKIGINMVHTDFTANDLRGGWYA